MAMSELAWKALMENDRCRMIVAFKGKFSMSAAIDETILKGMPFAALEIGRLIPYLATKLFTVKTTCVTHHKAS